MMWVIVADGVDFGLPSVFEDARSYQPYLGFPVIAMDVVD